MNEKRNFFFIAFFLAAAFLVRLVISSPRVISAQTCDSTCPPVGDSNYGACLSTRIMDCGIRITALQNQANTLSNQIAQFNAQIYLTQLKINQTQEQITLLGGRIDQLEVSLQALTDAFSSRAVATYKMARSGEPFFLLITSGNLTQTVERFHYLQKAQVGDHDLLVRLQGAQNIYKQNKTDQEKLQQQLDDQKVQLASQKAAKDKLLAETQGSEAVYKKLLAQAQAELAALSQYAESVGISLIPHQDLSDGWGKYFNQRDSQWGNLLANADTTNCRGGSCTLARIGCLVTSYTMVVSHFGGSLIPSDVATNPSNFSGTSADFLNPGPSANGHASSRLNNPSVQELMDNLNSGAVVIAGLSMNGGPYPDHYSDHWVVLRSVDGDSFRINDPLYPGAMNMSLKDHYSGWTIIQAIVYR